MTYFFFLLIIFPLQIVVAMSEFPELNDFVATAILYAPAAFLSNTETLAKYFAPMSEELYVIKAKLNGCNSRKKLIIFFLRF